jgi:F-type H+-transporting ATPase subunit epsilon
MAEPTKKPSAVAQEAHELQCIVVTPEQTVLDEVADFIVLPIYDGELGVLPGRAALIGRLGFGELRVRRGNQTQHFYIDGGFAQVRANVVTVLTPKAIPAAEIDAAVAEQALHTALAPATGDGLETQLKEQARARAQLRMARHSGMDAALPDHA